jgi:KaiC/GvpD/RAD55 family RecA-like ATPase
MKNGVYLVASGISFLDEAWGGVYSGGSYVVVGPRKSGRTSLGLQFASQSGEDGCIYFTTSRPRNLLIQSTALNLDLEQHIQERTIRVMRIGLPSVGGTDRSVECEIAERLVEIEQHVLETKPGRVVFDELTPFAGVDCGSVLPQMFARTVESFEAEGITSMFILGEPAAHAQRSVTELLVREATASIYLERTIPVSASDRPGGRMLIVPNVGHAEGQFVARYFVESRRPLQVESRETWCRIPLREEWTGDHGRTLLPDSPTGPFHDSPNSVGSGREPS